MAASRRGADDPVAVHAGVSHKCLAPVAGVPMIQRVIATLRATPGIGRIVVSVENAAILAPVPDLAAAIARGDIIVVESRATLAASVLAAIEAIEAQVTTYPLLITTADNALHTPEIVRTFCETSLALDCDATIGFTPAATILARYPTGQRAFHRFKDGDYSGCNIYMLHNARSAVAARAFASGGQFGKKPWRLVAAFGVGTFVLHMLRRLTLGDAMSRIGRGFGLEVRAVMLPFAEAPIDVDNAGDHALATEILKGRGP